jgi:hypothetical protein
MMDGARPVFRIWLAAGSLGLCGLLAGSAVAAETAALPTTDQQLLSTVRTALEQHDLDTFNELVNWDGASKMRRRAVTYQLRYGFGRPIRSITLEPSPADQLHAMESAGRFRANMPVEQQIRVVFDEPDTSFGKPPTALFLVGKEEDGYRIALVVPTAPPGSR